MLPANRSKNPTSNVSKSVIAHDRYRDVGIADEKGENGEQNGKKKHRAREGGVSQ